MAVKDIGAIVALVIELRNYYAVLDLLDENARFLDFDKWQLALLILLQSRTMSSNDEITLTLSIGVVNHALQPRRWQLVKKITVTLNPINANWVSN